MSANASVLLDEDRLWGELRATIDMFDDELASRPGYFAEGWSAKDALAHVGTWLAEAGAALEQIRGGSYVELRSDELDALNARFLDAMRDVSFTDVKSQATAARARMLHAWTQIPEPDEIAARWIAKSGPEHYQEHLPRLREWLDELCAG
jgi:hypothetical protein